LNSPGNLVSLPAQAHGPFGPREIPESLDLERDSEGHSFLIRVFSVRLRFFMFLVVRADTLRKGKGECVPGNQKADARCKPKKIIHQLWGVNIEETALILHFEVIVRLLLREVAVPKPFHSGRFHPSRLNRERAGL
jgi:hypothetical protein